MAPTKHAATKKPSSKRARTDSNHFKSADADMKYNDCYKGATIIMEIIHEHNTIFTRDENFGTCDDPQFISGHQPNHFIFPKDKIFVWSLYLQRDRYLWTYLPGVKEEY